MSPSQWPCYNDGMMNATLLSALVLLGCPRHQIQQASALSNTRWQGQIEVTTPCEAHGGYTASTLQVCMQFGQATGAQLGVDVDWDAQHLRPACDYFVFAATIDDTALILQRTGQSEQDDHFRLSRSGAQLVGTFQVHPSCAQWPVSLRLSPPEPHHPSPPPSQGTVLIPSESNP